MILPFLHFKAPAIPVPFSLPGLAAVIPGDYFLPI